MLFDLFPMPLVIFVGVVLVLFVVLPYFTPIEEEPKYIKVHPVIKNKDLEQWLKIYQAISIKYQGYWINEQEITEGTWERWAELTGKKQWKRVPNPDYVKPKEEKQDEAIKH